MFDDITEKEKENNQNNAGSPPRPEAENAPYSGAEKKKGVEDIFSETDKTDGAAGYHFKKARPQPVPYSGGQPPSSRGALFKKLLMIAVLIFVLAVFSAAGYWGGAYLAKNFIESGENTGSDKPAEANNNNTQAPAVAPPENNTKTNADMPDISDIPAQPEPPNGTVEIPIQNNAPVPATDTDQDGLTDEEERRLGTRIDSPDSDGDGLFDREEVMVYKTDPLNPDTDGDGFKDGEEVRSGYNPKGAGKLYGDASQ